MRLLVDAVLSQGKPLQANCPPKRACGDAEHEWQLPHALQAAPPRRSPCAHHQPPNTVPLAGVPPQMRIVHSHSGRIGLRLNPASPQDKNEHSTVAVEATIGATLEDADQQKSPLLRHAVVRPSAWRLPDHASPCSDPLHPHLGRLDPQTVKVPGSVVQGLLGSCTVSLFVLQGVVLVGGSPAMHGQYRAQACARTADLHLVLRHAARATVSCTTFFANGGAEWARMDCHGECPR